MSKHIDEYISTLQSQIKRNSEVINQLHLDIITMYDVIVDYNREIEASQRAKHKDWYDEYLVRVKANRELFYKKITQRKKAIAKHAHDQKVLKKLYQDLIWLRRIIS